ncbi:MAG TPA: type II toxin-antitoxin system RelE/ParE family toxin [Myxococcota bacterium]|nr:type II toxin-antitoxin system RelE/ParE family toxin [Myxococcota bacterium]HOH77432.1 type II toxin-antitoxin system RelE/ParE family toxin [Myxococcota bacterium]HPV04615.1 type II toxin-antitoxin system RelE/ParE family toxin [Myxococcota bacterium]
MIGSFKSRDTERLFRREHTRAFPAEIARSALRKLLMLDAAVRLDDLRAPPGNRLEALKADRAGQFSIRVNDRWRICFEWSGGTAEHVELVDYHD